MKYLISGASGRMGHALYTKRNEHIVVAGVSRNKFDADFPVYTSFEDVTEDFDLIIDFTVSENAKKVIDFASKVNKPLVIGTTALSAKDETSLKELAKKVPVLYSHNTAIGVNIFLSILEYASKKLYQDFDIEIVERHDKNKLDAPSGTSKMVVHSIEDGADKKFNIINGRLGKGARNNDDIAIHSIRGGNLASEHYVSFIGEDETIEINHVAWTYDIYASGAIKAGSKLITMPPALYEMKDMIPNL